MRLICIEIMNIKGYFTPRRIMEDEVPQGYFMYQLRHADDWGVPETIENFVSSDFYGTLLLEKEIEINDYLQLSDVDKDIFIQL